jgi:phosphonate transport system substrate-binding protein
VAIDFSKRTEPLNNTPRSTNELYIAVAAMTSPAETLHSYHELLDYIGKELDRPVQIVQRKTYQEVNDLLANGELHAAFLCSGGYVAARESFDAELLAAPMIGGKSTYQAYILVHQDSRIRDFHGLRQHSFAFTDPLSNTGWLYPVSRLSALGATPSSFFSQVTYTYGHDRSIEAVALKIADGASVDGLVYEYLAKIAPEKVRSTRIIERSPEFGIPPVVTGPRTAPGLKEKLRSALLTMHEDARGQDILRELLIDKFVRADERAYDSIGQVKERVGPWRP